jgi:hypothetical protein
VLPTSGAAVSLQSSSRIVIECLIKGAPQIHAGGVSLAEADPGAGPCRFNTIGCSAIDPASLRGGASVKLMQQGRPIRSAGSFADDNLATGIMN